MSTRDWKSIKEVKILVIGHDPRLQKSDTIAEYVLFADYYFREIPKNNSEKRKYELAKSTFEHIEYLTKGNFYPENIYLTNLCNSALEHAPKVKTVLIHKDKAESGLLNIEKILSDNSTIEYIFPMSLQVNYWLQKLNFYSSNDEFLKFSEPKENGIKSIPPYFQPKKPKTFTMICGKAFSINNGKQKVVPILHTKNFPLKGKFLEAYERAYNEIRKMFDN